MTDLTRAVTKTISSVFANMEKPNGEVQERIAALKANIGKVANIDLSEIETKENIRNSIDTSGEGFLRLVESIKRYGVLENIVVELRLNRDETDYKLVCIAGHRRILAAKEAGNIIRVPCLLQAYTHRGDSVGVALAENLNREDLHCLDVADGYRDLLNSGWQEEELSKHFCRDIRTIRHYLKMSQWSDEIKGRLRANPQVFSTRVIMRQLAYRRFSSSNELKRTISHMVSGTRDVKAKKTRSKGEPAHSVDRAKLNADLQAYLKGQKLLSTVIKDEIKKAFMSLGLI